MARPSDRDIFLKALRAHGSRAGNTLLQRELNWSEQKYWNIHGQLHAEGLIEKGRGYGGTVILVNPAPGLPGKSRSVDTNSAVPAEAEKPSTALVEAMVEEYTSEIQLYAPVKKQLDSHWAIRRQL